MTWGWFCIYSYMNFRFEKLAGLTGACLKLLWKPHFHVFISKTVSIISVFIMLHEKHRRFNKLTLHWWNYLDYDCLWTIYNVLPNYSYFFVFEKSWSDNTHWHKRNMYGLSQYVYTLLWQNYLIIYNTKKMCAWIQFHSNNFADIWHILCSLICLLHNNDLSYNMIVSSTRKVYINIQDNTCLSTCQVREEISQSQIVIIHTHLPPPCSLTLITYNYAVVTVTHGRRNLDLYACVNLCTYLQSCFPPIINTHMNSWRVQRRNIYEHLT